MDNVALVQVIDCIKHLSNGLRRILLREFSILANPIKQLATSGQLCHDIEFVLEYG